MTPLVRSRLNGADPMILAAIANYSTQQIVAAPRAGIRKLEELRGRIVGVTQYGSEGDTFLRIALKSAGLRPGPGHHGFVEFPQKAAFLNLLQKTNVGDVGWLKRFGLRIRFAVQGGLDRLFHRHGQSR